MGYYDGVNYNDGNEKVNDADDHVIEDDNDNGDDKDNDDKRVIRMIITVILAMTVGIMMIITITMNDRKDKKK